MLLRLTLISIFSFLLNIYKSEAQTKLLDAIIDDDTTQIKKLLADGANTNKRKLTIHLQFPKKIKSPRFEQPRRRKFSFRIHKGPTALGEATLRNNLTIVKLLLEHGARPNKRSIPVLTPISWAAHNGNVEMIQLLLQYGAKLNRYYRKWRTTPLIEAAERNQTEAAKFLLKENIPIDFADRTGMTALSYAAKKKNFELVKLFLEKGADVNHINKNKETILKLACADDIFFEKASLELIQFLVDKGALITDGAFYSACYKGQIDLAKFFLSKGLPVKKEFIFGAIRTGDIEFVKYVEANYSLDIGYIDSITKQTSLIVATQGYAINESPYKKINVELIKYILTKRKARGIVNTENEMSLLNLVTNSGDDSITAATAELFVANFETVNAVDKNLDYSVLMWAASNKSKKTVELLISSGANINFKNKSGRTALSVAAWKYDNTEVIQYLIQKGADINNVDSNGCSSAINAAIFNNLENIRTLIDLGADPNIKSKYGLTLLDYIKNDEFRTYLISRGAKIGADIK